MGASGFASLGIKSIPLPSPIIFAAKSIISAVSGRVARYSLSLTGAWSVNMPVN